VFVFKVIATAKYVLSSTNICLELFFGNGCCSWIKKDLVYFDILCIGNLSHERHGSEKVTYVGKV
jgi:hypothetical protein